ncbi:hypothetical protein K8089_15075 [Aequorivita sp. F47161]|uniref:Uncharacterized protein n=1 Tax=Aequorivita vitellina TaxID=2874475 RepID=A0A9X1QYS0_9FLAO|nr:hypothetical protein [Aequorivita vitellina]MCG2420346.1 hypothetical protein [Aequorivita vitellina]
MAAKKPNEQKKSSGSRKLADDILKGIKNEEILSSAQKVINSAVNVLEEEIAAGILAAKKIEKKVLDVDNIRSDPDDLMNRIRRDTHEAVDLFLDAITALTNKVNNLTESENAKAEKAEAAIVKPSPALTLLETEQPLQPGQSENFTFTLFEDSEKAAKISFQKTSLFGPNGQSINGRALKITPLNLTLKPKEEREVNVKLSLPKNAQPGTYNALITDSENALVKVVLNVVVIP